MPFQAARRLSKNTVKRAVTQKWMSRTSTCNSSWRTTRNLPG